MSGSAYAGTIAERHRLHAMSPANTVLGALASAPGRPLLALDKDLHGCSATRIAYSERSYAGAVTCKSTSRTIAVKFACREGTATVTASPGSTSVAGKLSLMMLYSPA